jgi:hypothetical protein
MSIDESMNNDNGLCRGDCVYIQLKMRRGSSYQRFEERENMLGMGRQFPSGGCAVAYSANVIRFGQVVILSINHGKVSICSRSLNRRGEALCVFTTVYSRLLCLCHTAFLLMSDKPGS